jgi:hypothetical protein
VHVQGRRRWQRRLLRRCRGLQSFFFYIFFIFYFEARGYLFCSFFCAYNLISLGFLKFG